MISQIHGGLVVSCQAYEGEPLYNPQSSLMGYMAFAAQEGGAVGIRANTVRDIQSIKKSTNLPIIGIVKRQYPDSEIYITPTLHEVEELIDVNCEMIAMDATMRLRPNSEPLPHFFRRCRRLFDKQLFMADCSTVEEAYAAEDMGFDVVATTMSGYTKYTSQNTLPDFDMLEKLVKRLKIPVILEGGVWEPKEVTKALELGAWAVVVGGAIANPEKITRRFVNATKSNECKPQSIPNESLKKL